jgi:hypothetical protein
VVRDYEPSGSSVAVGAVLREDTATVYRKWKALGIIAGRSLFITYLHPSLRGENNTARRRVNNKDEPPVSTSVSLPTLLILIPLGTIDRK